MEKQSLPAEILNQIDKAQKNEITEYHIYTKLAGSIKDEDNYYISVARDYPFARRFLEMAGISLGVALLSFGLGWLIRFFPGAEI